MARLYLVNAFSINMLKVPFRGSQLLLVRELGVVEARKQLETFGFESAIGHESTAKVLSRELGIPIKVNRISVSLDRGDSAIVAQISGPRLPEGAVLDERDLKDLSIRYYKVTVL